MTDYTCLAEGYMEPADMTKTGLNLNEIIVGTTGCGKSVSNAYSRLLHTNNSSVVVPIAKGAIKKKFRSMFENRGYKVVDLDFTHPENCTVGYNPLDYIRTEEEVVQCAKNLVYQDEKNAAKTNADPYWTEAATSILAAEIALSRINAAEAGRRATFYDVIELHRSIEVSSRDDVFKSNVDCLFEEAEKRYPGNQASELWKTVDDLSKKTASCIFSVLNSAIDKVFSNQVLEMTAKEERIDFQELGERKVALFITTSPMNRSLLRLINLMYADMFRCLFESAEENDNGSLKVPVHIICDDFACCGKIVDFEDYISIFRAAGISVTLLLQSESQLSAMYGENAATTIINNCDTYVYMGGMDITTCEHVARRLDKPLKRVLNMPCENVVVFRRGREPVEARRYQTYLDPLYLKLDSGARKGMDMGA